MGETQYKTSSICIYNNSNNKRKKTTTTTKERKKTADQTMPERERKRVPDHRSDVLKGALPQGPPAHPRNTLSK